MQVWILPKSAQNLKLHCNTNLKEFQKELQMTGCPKKTDPQKYFMYSGIMYQHSFLGHPVILVNWL